MSSTWSRLRFSASMGRDPILAALTPEERWCYIAGVLPLAAYSPQKGRLLLTDGVAVDADEVADVANVPVRIARRTLQRLVEIGAVCTDEDEGCLYVAHTGFWDRASDGENRWGKDRYARWASAAGCVSDEQLRARVDFYGGLCWICRTAPYDTIDHVKPLARGGSNWPANLRPACRRCNSSKGARWPYRRPV